MSNQVVQLLRNMAENARGVWEEEHAVKLDKAASMLESSWAAAHAKRTLRDEFAGLAMQGMTRKALQDNDWGVDERIAVRAYSIADAMMAARGGVIRDE